ncbi:MAG: RluA family pseudouridine synthase [Candidatus Omnitrophica bacterium]|nr:RluA family pseudouridine synthase [Candidatus Omnitrophota bacterium]
MRVYKRPEEELLIETDYRIVYDDEWFMAVEKPAPLPVHAGGRFKEKNLLSFLKRDFPALCGGLRIVNRLDSETSGLVLIAKSSDSAGKLGTVFEKRQINKEYQAVVLGVPKEKKGSVSIPLRDTIDRSHRLSAPDEQGQKAITDYEILKKDRAAALLKIVPHTGRMHQIRAHMAFLGHPIAGDKIYIDLSVFDRYVHEGWQEDMLEIIKAHRLLLHASKLEFLHPWTAKSICFASEPPACFSQYLQSAIH